MESGLPNALALLHCGAISYYCLVDPKVRNSHQSLRNRVHHWAKSHELSKVGLTAFTIATAAAALNNWKKTSEQGWLVGSVLFFSMIPFQFICMKDEEKALTAD